MKAENWKTSKPSVGDACGGGTGGGDNRVVPDGGGRCGACGSESNVVS